MRSIVISMSLLLLASRVSAQATLVSGFGGAADYGTSCLGPNDDGSSRMIDLTPIFPTGVQFYDRTHTSMFVNTNGNVTFGGGVSAFTPSAFPIANQPMIAPFWADVDIRPPMPERGFPCGGFPDGDGRPESYAGDCASPSENGVWWHMDVPGRRVIVTWDRVGYYMCHTDRRMTFQLILTATSGATCGGGGDFDVEFRFNRCEWNTGDASGGAMGLAREPTRCERSLLGGWGCPIGNLPCTGASRTCTPVPAQSGFDAGNLRDFVEIMGSRTNSIHTTLCTMSNVEDPGVWRFSIRSGVIECPGAGDPCSTGMMGVCAAGRTQCVGGGIECRPELGAGSERCNGLDDDCDGTVDDGAPCGAEQICDRGVCVGRCFEGGCADGEACNAEGRCVSSGCDTLTCGAGQRCIAGACVEACDGVVCPTGLACRSGRCVDLCAGAVCDDCTVCEAGDCVPRCAFAACPSGRTCRPDGRCVEDACAAVTCPSDQACSGGSCIDRCMGAVCPAGEVCRAGACIVEDRPDAGPPPPADASMIGRDGGAVAIDAGSEIDGGAPDAGRRRPPSTSGGCGCATSGGRGGTLVLVLAALALALVRRRG